jgi:hypothetical protein
MPTTPSRKGVTAHISPANMSDAHKPHTAMHALAKKRFIFTTESDVGRIAQQYFSHARLYVLRLNVATANPLQFGKVPTGAIP